MIDFASAIHVAFVILGKSNTDKYILLLQLISPWSLSKDSLKSKYSLGSFRSCLLACPQIVSTCLVLQQNDHPIQDTTPQIRADTVIVCQTGCFSLPATTKKKRFGSATQNNTKPTTKLNSVVHIYAYLTSMQNLSMADLPFVSRA